MGNLIGGDGGWLRRRRSGNRRNHPPPPPPQQPQPEITPNSYVFAAPSQYPNPNHPPPPPYYQYSGYYPPPPPAMPIPLPAPYDHHHRGHAPHMDPGHVNWVSGPFSYGPVNPPPPPTYVEHQKAVTIRNDVNIKKETLRIEADEENPGHFLVAFTFDATLAGSITIIFFAKEGEDCNLEPTRENLFKPVKVPFEQGLGQKFRQPTGTGINFSVLNDTDFLKKDDIDVFPLVVKAEAASSNQSESATGPGLPNCQITQAMFEKDKGEYRVRVVKQILWVNAMRYELQEIYGIGNSVDADVDGNENDPGKECVICLSEPRDTTVLPCRHMCMCSGCAKVLRFQTNRCPICRQPVERLLEIKVSNDGSEGGS